MSSIPPAVQAFWSSPLVATPAFGFLQAWAEAIHIPMPEAVRSPRPASHISAAIRRVADSPPPVTSHDPVVDALDVLQDRREYAGSLLRLSVDHLLAALESVSEDGFLHADSKLEPLREWLPKIEDALSFYRLEGMPSLQMRLARSRREGRVPQEACDWMTEVAERLYTRLSRVYTQTVAVSELIEGRISAAVFQEIRRRLSWVLSLREFDRVVDWNGMAVARSAELPPEVRKDRFETGMLLLFQHRPLVSQKELDLYERAARSGVRGRDIAFDLDRTLGDALDHPSTPYDEVPEETVHQFPIVRIPYRGMQALLLGLWAAGNRLRLYTFAENGPESHEAFFNDFPLLKVAFGLVTPGRSGDTVTRDQLHASPHYMDGVKRRQFGARHFGTRDGLAFLETLRVTSGIRNVDFLKDCRIPFPEFPFDVLVGPPSPLDHKMRLAGFGSRGLDATPDTDGLLTRLEAYFARPESGMFHGVSEAVLEWLDSWEIP